MDPRATNARHCTPLMGVGVRAPMAHTTLVALGRGAAAWETVCVQSHRIHHARTHARPGLKPLKQIKPFYPRAKAPGLYGLSL